MGRWEKHQGHWPSQDTFCSSMISKSDIYVHIDNHQDCLPIQEGVIVKAVRGILSFLQIQCEEISLYFTTKKEISALHAEYFDDPTPTDCISFPVDKNYLGDIFICPAVAIEYAKAHQLDAFEETLLYIIHGILHLIGFDDIEPADQRQMRVMEKKCLNYLKL